MTDIVQDALTGARGGDQKRIAEAGRDFIETLLRKNKDYGSSVWQRPILVPDLDIGDVILVRMGDKINRIQTLLKQPPEVADESLRDTVKDLGAYCLLWLARPDPSEWHSETEVELPGSNRVRLDDVSTKSSY